MLFKELGKTRVLIPEIGLGTWSYHAGPELLRQGLDAGAAFIDTAESYGSEPVVAEAIAGRRDAVFLATKVSPDHFRRAAVLKAADNSLRRLRTDHLDLYQLHEPNEGIPIEETMAAMEELVQAGKVRFLGVSNFSVAQLQRARKSLGKHPLVSNQVRFNLIDRTINAGVLPYCQSHGITLIAYSPLARGFQHILDCDPQCVLADLAKSSERSPVQLALNWCLCQEHVVVIPKANSAAHLLENCGASDWRLSPDQARRLEEAILCRQRGQFEGLLRRHIPPALKRGIQRLAPLCPASLRRRFY